MPGSLVPAPLFWGLGPAGREPGQDEHGQADVGVPGSPGADLVVIQPGLSLGLLEALLNRHRDLRPCPAQRDRPLDGAPGSVDVVHVVTVGVGGLLT